MMKKKLWKLSGRIANSVTILALTLAIWISIEPDYILNKNLMKWRQRNRQVLKLKKNIKEIHAIFVPKPFLIKGKDSILGVETLQAFCTFAFSLEFSKFLRSLEQFIQTEKGQNNSW